MQRLRHLAYRGIFLAAVLWLGCAADPDGGPIPVALDSLTGVQPRISLSPKLHTLTPEQGPNLGGTTLILAGEDFAAGATVTVGGAAAAQVTVWSGTRISARLPANPGVFGSAAVVVRNPACCFAKPRRLNRWPVSTP